MRKGMALGWKNSCRQDRIYGASENDSINVGCKVNMCCEVWEGYRPVRDMALVTSQAGLFLLEAMELSAWYFWQWTFSMTVERW